MSPTPIENIPPELQEKIKERLISVFKDVCYNNPNILKAKSESDSISAEIKKFILNFLEGGKEISEVDLLIHSKQKGLELVENHNLIFFEEEIDSIIRMRAFLIPGIKIDPSEETGDEKVTEHDLESLDHELCISFKSDNKNIFTKIGNLIDIRASLAKSLNNIEKDDKEVPNLISDKEIFQRCLEEILNTAADVLSK